MQPTALVREAWIRLAGDENKVWDKGGISSLPPPKRCVGFSSTALAPKAGSAEAAALNRLAIHKDRYLPKPLIARKSRENLHEIGAQDLSEAFH